MQVFGLMKTNTEKYAFLFHNHPQIVHHAKILFEELQDLDDHGITVEVDDLERYGIVCEPSEYATRGIHQLDNGLFSVHFKVKILSVGDLKVIVALWGLSGCGAGTPCPWCFCDSSQFGNWEADISHRYVYHLCYKNIYIIVTSSLVASPR